VGGGVGNRWLGRSIAGTSLLRFDQHGLVVEQRDVWASESGRRDLPDRASGPA